MKDLILGTAVQTYYFTVIDLNRYKRLRMQSQTTDISYEISLQSRDKILKSLSQLAQNVKNANLTSKINFDKVTQLRRQMDFPFYCACKLQKNSSVQASPQDKSDDQDSYGMRLRDWRQVGVTNQLLPTPQLLVANDWIKAFGYVIFDLYPQRVQKIVDQQKLDYKSFAWVQSDKSALFGLKDLYTPKRILFLFKDFLQEKNSKGHSTYQLLEWYNLLDNVLNIVLRTLLINASHQQPNYTSCIRDFRHQMTAQESQKTLQKLLTIFKVSFKREGNKLTIFAQDLSKTVQITKKHDTELQIVFIKSSRP